MYNSENNFLEMMINNVWYPKIISSVRTKDIVAMDFSPLTKI